MIEKIVAHGRTPDRRRIQYRSDCRRGRFLFNHHDQYVGRALEQYGEYQEAEIALFDRFIQPGDVVLDVGANIGTHTVWMSKRVGRHGSVLAFEPQRLVFYLLCANLAINDCDNAYAYQMALGAVPGSTRIPCLDPDQDNNFGGLHAFGHEAGEPVSVATIDRLGLDRLNFVKVDVEGFEAEVLLGGQETIGRLRPILYVECDRQDKWTDTVNALNKIGYSGFWHTPPLFNPANQDQRQYNYWPDIVSRNIVAVHSDDLERYAKDIYDFTCQDDQGSRKAVA